MIIKMRDATVQTIERIERRAARQGEHVCREACADSAVRSRDEPPTRRACAFIDARFASSPEWAVIHDLRLVAGGCAARFDHLLIDDTLDIVLVDTRFVDSGLYLFDHGRCETFDGVERRLVASPLDRMSRDMCTLAETVRSLEVPRGHCRHRPHPVLRGCVLIDPALRLGASIDGARSRIGVYPRDSLLPMLRKRRLRRSGNNSERLSSAELATFASALVEHHRSVLTDEPSAFTGT